MSMFSFPAGYGHVFAVLGGSVIMNTYLAVNVSMARKQYKIEYPALYAPAGHQFEKEFNCVQRAHQNTLEVYPMVMLQMCVCGFVYPVTSAAFGGIWVLGRFLYGYGYAKYGPDGRTVGGIVSHLGDLPLAAMCMKIGYDMLMKSK